MKKILFLIPLLLLSLLLNGCGKLTEEEYNKKATEFDRIFDNISQDFYQQTKKSLEGIKPDKNLFDMYSEDISKMSKVFGNYDEKSIPQDKVADFTTKQNLILWCLSIETSTITNKLIDQEICNKFIAYADKRFTELGTLQTVQAATTKSMKPNLELLEYTDKYENGLNYIVGTIVNNTDKTYNYVVVKINIYDKNDTLIGNTLDSVDNLEPNKQWKFKAMVTEEGFAKYKITDISGM